jgi:hypothetical protein
MRRFLVHYQIYDYCGEYQHHTCYITLKSGQKANMETFENLINFKGKTYDILSWSLVEE